MAEGRLLMACQREITLICLWYSVSFDYSIVMKKFASIFFCSFLLVGCGREAAPFDQFAQCLTDVGARMYGSDSCPHCQAQKKAFKGSFDLVDYINCEIKPGECQDAGVRAYPTWVVDGKVNEGRMSLSELAELSECPLKKGPVEEEGESQE